MPIYTNYGGTGSNGYYTTTSTYSVWGSRTRNVPSKKFSIDDEVICKMFKGIKKIIKILDFDAMRGWLYLLNDGHYVEERHLSKYVRPKDKNGNYLLEF